MSYAGSVRIWKTLRNSGVYILLFIFCALSAMRDVYSEFLFKGESDLDPFYLLFVFSSITQIVSGSGVVFQYARHTDRKFLFSRKDINGLLWVNFYTLIAYVTFFLAIDTDAGAGIISLVDYGSSPLLTALVAVFLLNIKLDRIYWLGALVGITGILMLFFNRIGDYQGPISVLWLGIIFAIVSSLSSAFYRVYLKRLLNRGISKLAILFLRLFGVTFLLAGYLIVQPDAIDLEILPQLILLGLFSFTMPLLLILSVLQNTDIRHFSLLLFLIPAFTYLFSALLGHTEFFFLDILAAGFILMGVSLERYYQKS